MSIDESLAGVAGRMQSKEMDMVNSAVVIQQRTGGNLAEIIEKVTITISDRIKIKNTVRVLTAQGRASGWVGLHPRARDNHLPRLGPVLLVRPVN